MRRPQDTVAHIPRQIRFAVHPVVAETQQKHTTEKAAMIFVVERPPSATHVSLLVSACISPLMVALTNKAVADGAILFLIHYLISS